MLDGQRANQMTSADACIYVHYSVKAFIKGTDVPIKHLFGP